jgi:hypothetical protein
MKTITTRAIGMAALALLAGCGAGAEPARAPFPPPDIAGGALVGLFEGKFPCDTCVKIKTALLLLQDPANGSPTRYLLRQLFVSEPIDTAGSWTIRRGTAGDPAAAVCELRPDDAGPPIRYQRVGADILLLLDEALRPRVGNAAYSFTLSRTR